MLYVSAIMDPVVNTSLTVTVNVSPAAIWSDLTLMELQIVQNGGMI
jgi:hypothetical protein